MDEVPMIWVFNGFLVLLVMFVVLYLCWLLLVQWVAWVCMVCHTEEPVGPCSDSYPLSTSLDDVESISLQPTATRWHQKNWRDTCQLLLILFTLGSMPFVMLYEFGLSNPFGWGLGILLFVCGFALAAVYGG